MAALFDSTLGEVEDGEEEVVVAVDVVVAEEEVAAIWKRKPNIWLKRSSARLAREPRRACARLSS
jgi:hypothetical protein